MRNRSEVYTEMGMNRKYAIGSNVGPAILMQVMADYYVSTGINVLDVKDSGVLTETERRFARLALIDRMTNQQIAKIENVPHYNVGTTFRTAIRRLRFNWQKSPNKQRTRDDSKDDLMSVVRNAPIEDVYKLLESSHPTILRAFANKLKGSVQ